MITTDCHCYFEDSTHLANSCGSDANVTLLMSLVDFWIRNSCHLSDPCRRAPRVKRDEIDTFDFIIVGAGVAGPVLASRLSENPDWNVLLLEAGPEEPTSTSVPAFAFSAIGTHLDWKYKTVPQEGACLANGGVCDWPRGKMVGGTGAMTGMMYSRGHRKLFDDWANDGNTGWSYEECLQYFIKSESNLNPDIIEEKYHGKSGPMPVQRFESHPKLAEDIIRAGQEALGYQEIDLNGENMTGFAIAQVMIKDGLRASTARMFLRPMMDRKNLVVKINSHATQITIDPRTKLATGVKYLDEEGVTHTVTATKEVILSAGAIGSPQLLLLSGVGPESDLQKHSIPVIKNLPVGHNLQNHVAVPISFSIKDDNKRMLTMDAVKEYIHERKGPLASTGMTQLTAFMESSYAKDHVADIQVFFDGFNASCSSSGSSYECSNGRISENCGRRIVGARPTNLMALSRGKLQLRSNDPMDYPIIDPKYFQHKQDVEILIEGIKLLINISKAEPLQKWGFELDKTPAPGCEHITFGSDSYWECVIRRHTGPENHQAGTCKMGPVGDPTAVVDPELRVHGIPNLRVADASIFPRVTNANPVSNIIMVAEKASDMIMGAWRSSSTEQDTRYKMSLLEWFRAHPKKSQGLRRHPHMSKVPD